MLQIYHFFFIFMLSTEKIIHFFKLQIKTLRQAHAVLRHNNLPHRQQNCMFYTII